MSDGPDDGGEPPSEAEQAPRVLAHQLLLQMERTGVVERVTSGGRVIWQRGPRGTDETWERAQQLMPGLTEEHPDPPRPPEAPHHLAGLDDLIVAVETSLRPREQTGSSKHVAVSIEPGEEHSYDEPVQEFVHERTPVPHEEVTRRGIMVGMTVAFVLVFLLQVGFALILGDDAWARVGPILAAASTLVAVGFGYVWGHYFSGRH